MFTSENPDTIIVLLAMAMGASMLEEEAIAQFLFQKAKRWSSRFDEMVNVQAVQMALLMISFLLAYHCMSSGLADTRPLTLLRREGKA
jgi:hypothetical protein